MSMAAVCAWRVVTGLYHLVFKRQLRTDPITAALSVLITSKTKVDYVDPKVLSQYLSLLFIGFLVANSMRNFVYALNRLFFAVGGGGGGTSTFLVLFVAEMQGLVLSVVGAAHTELAAGQVQGVHRRSHGRGQPGVFLLPKLLRHHIFSSRRLHFVAAVRTSSHVGGCDERWG
jgi:hypothetical protein